MTPKRTPKPCPHKNHPDERRPSVTSLIASPVLSTQLAIATSLQDAGMYYPGCGCYIPMISRNSFLFFSWTILWIFRIFSRRRRSLILMDSTRARRVSVPSRSLPKLRSRTVLSPSGFVWGLVTPSSKSFRSRFCSLGLGGDEIGIAVFRGVYIYAMVEEEEKESNCRLLETLNPIQPDPTKYRRDGKN